MRSGRVTSDKNTPLLPLRSVDERLRNIGHSMSTGNLTWGDNSVTVSNLIHYDSLLQNATAVTTKCDSYLFTKCNKVYWKMRQVFSYKMRQFYYKMQQLLQVATNLLQIATVKRCKNKFYILSYFNFYPGFRSTYSRMFFKKDIFKNFTIFTGKHLCWSLFLIKVWRLATLLKRYSNTMPVNIAKFLRTLFFPEHSAGCFWGFKL